MAELEIDVVSKASGDGLTKAADQVKELTSATAAHNTTAEAAATAEKGVATATEGAALAGKVMSTVLVEIASVAIPAMIAAAASLVAAMQQAAKEMQENNLAAILHGQISSFDGLTEAASSLAAGIKQSFGDVREEARMLDEDLKRNLGNIDQTLQQTLRLIEAQKKLAMAQAKTPEEKAAAEGDAEQQTYEVTRQAKIEALNAQKENAAKSKALADDAAKRAEAARTESNRLGDLNKATNASAPDQLKALEEEEKKVAADLSKQQSNLENIGEAPAAGSPDPGSLARLTAQSRAADLEERLAAIRAQREQLRKLSADRQSKATTYSGTATQQEAAAKALAEKAARDAAGVADMDEDFTSWDTTQQAILSLNSQTRSITTQNSRAAISNREVAAGRRAAVKGMRDQDQRIGAAESLFVGKDASNDSNQDIYLRAAAVLKQGHPALRALIDTFIADHQLTHQEIGELKKKIELARKTRKADKALE